MMPHMIPFTNTVSDFETMELSDFGFTHVADDMEEILMSTRCIVMKTKYGAYSYANPMTIEAIDNVSYIFASLAQLFHAFNRRMGWWTDLTTGKPLDRNMGELLMLAVSELAEGAEGHYQNAMDDKLPHRKMLPVELGDCCIRLFDTLGARHPLTTIRGMFKAVLCQPWQPLIEHGQSSYASLLVPVLHLSRALEGHRKDSVSDEYFGFPVEGIELVRAFVAVVQIGDQIGFDLPMCVQEKAIFNASREDHKPENRRKAGGKKI